MTETEKKILAIETSCDETSVAVVQMSSARVRVLSHVVNSQIVIHAAYGGVVPEVAARQHSRHLIPLIERSLREAGLQMADIDLIAATQGPGLVGSLMVGLEVAKTLAWLHRKPFMPVNHLLGHMWSWLLPQPLQSQSLSLDFPFVCLIVSGGHTELLVVESTGRYRLLGRTLDDAAGEAFDKVAKLLGLGYPGGPALGRRAAHGDRTAFAFPRPLLHSGDYNFSFSGLKTAVLYQVRALGQLNDQHVDDLAASFETAVVEVLLAKSYAAATACRAHSLAVVGGVSANQYLRGQLQDQSTWPILLPELTYTGDNAAMIAAAAYWQYADRRSASQFLSLAARPNLPL